MTCFAFLNILNLFNKDLSLYVFWILMYHHAGVQYVIILILSSWAIGSQWSSSTVQFNCVEQRHLCNFIKFECQAQGYVKLCGWYAFSFMTAIFQNTIYQRDLYNDRYPWNKSGITNKNFKLLQYLKIWSIIGEPVGNAWSKEYSNVTEVLTIRY